MEEDPVIVISKQVEGVVLAIIKELVLLFPLFVHSNIFLFLPTFASARLSRRLHWPPGLFLHSAPILGLLPIQRTEAPPHRHLLVVLRD